MEKWSERCNVAGFKDGGRAQRKERCGLWKTETDSALGPPEGTQPYRLYDFSPVRLTPNLKSTELQDNKSVLF